MALYAESATDKADFDSHTRCKRAVELMLTSRENPSVEVDRVLADDPQFVFAHCLRAAIIVRGDHDAARSKLVASVTAIEANCSDIDAPARRHASAARAWLEGDQALAVERYRHLGGDARSAQRIIDGTPGIALRPQARNDVCTNKPARHAVLSAHAIQWQSNQNIADVTASRR
jgi:ATP/maltotriose-dependent transcriptional regulator MalT